MKKMKIPLKKKQPKTDKPKSNFNVVEIEGNFYNHTGLSQNVIDMYSGTINPINPRFSHFKTKEDYENAGVKYTVAMTAKELDTEEAQDSKLNDKHYIIEEKFDGTRGHLHFFKTNELKDPNILQSALLKGTSFEGGKQRVYDYFIQDHTNAEKADFIKNEYGTGGRSFDYLDFSGNIMYSPKGYEITMRFSKDSKNETTYKYTWISIANEVDNLIKLGAYYPNQGYTRCFSRRVSEKTGWFCENTDLLPQLREINIPELAGTVIDGELFIPNQPFKDVSSTLNCSWDKAIHRQLELGFIVFHAFDILYFKGIDLRKMPLKRRKEYLKIVVDKINSPFVELVDYQYCGNLIDARPYAKTHGSTQEVYENLLRSKKLKAFPNFNREAPNNFKLSPRAFYEYIVASGGEGVMVKPDDGKYLYKRGWEYSKIKKFLTREVILLGFTPPTKEYKGKFPRIDKWDYWETDDGTILDLSTMSENDIAEFKDIYYPKHCTPVSKYYAKGWIGNLLFGVIVSEDELPLFADVKKFKVYSLTIEGKRVSVLLVGECSGMTEEEREIFSNKKEEYKYCTIEVKANEIFKDTGKLRHPRFMRVRPDKSPLSCTWKDHISSSI